MGDEVGESWSVWSGGCGLDWLCSVDVVVVVAEEETPIASASVRISMLRSVRIRISIF